NVARVKRLIDTVNYNGPICAMTDNTKLKPRLRYSPNLGCIIGSTLSNEETTVNIYSNDIPKIINNVKSENGIAKNVRAYILQIPLSKFPPIVIALLPNKGADTADSILQLHKRLILEIAPSDVNGPVCLHILSLGSDGAITEYQAQQSIVNIQTSEKLTVIEPQLKINFSCRIFDYIGPVIHVQDPKHAKKTARNAIMSGARLLTFGNSSARYDHFLQLINQNSSILYKNDVIKLDRQDDAAAYRTFSNQTFAIFTSLCESLVLLVKAHREYYSQIPFLPWYYGSEPVEHFFGIARQLNSDFDFADLIQMLPKISQYTKALRSKKLFFDQEKTVRQG
ncbi:hypothetical protein RhiirA4_308934, partial [Rhizophagus irregularis]